MGRHQTLTLAQRAEVSAMIARGVTDDDIARAFGVHRTTILRLRRKLANAPLASADASLPDMARDPAAWLAQQPNSITALQRMTWAYQRSAMTERDQGNRDAMLAAYRLWRSQARLDPRPIIG